MNYLISAVIGYLLGSIPTAFLLLKKTQNKDITRLGSGNIGAMNTYDVTNSKFLGILVFIIDAFKGLLSVYVTLLVLPVSFIFPAIALIFAVVGHNYNPWLKFKGGRGLSTAFGGTVLLAPYIPAIWILFWALAFLINRNVIIDNTFAIIFTLLTLFLGVDKIYNLPYLLKADSPGLLLLFASSLLLILFIKHTEPLNDLKKFE